MKREILRITNLDYQYSTVKCLHGIDFCLLEGEITGFLGLSDSGKDVLVKLICGEGAESTSLSHLYIMNKSGG